MTLFFFALLTVTLSSVASGCADKMRVATALMGNWVVLTAIAAVTDNQFMWPLSASADYIAAAAVIMFPISRWQIIVSGLFGLELIMHAAFALSSQSDAVQYAYWYELHYTSWAQVAVFGGWLLHDIARQRFGRLCDSRWRARYPDAVYRRVEGLPGEKECS